MLPPFDPARWVQGTSYALPLVAALALPVLMSLSSDETV
jgi:hypothetical protein